MPKIKKLFLIALCSLLAACNMPATDSEENLNDQAATIVALTIATENISTPTKENTPQPTPTLAVTNTPKPTITPTYSVPMIKLTENTNCRSGPGQSFDILTTLLAGASVEIVGKHSTENYWVVKAEGMDEPCWLWGEFATTSGSYWVVPTMSAPPTAAPKPANQPTNVRWDYDCTFNGVNSDVSVTLTWNDETSDELGFRVYRDNAQIAELPPNTTSYSDALAADTSQTITYGISSYNAVSESPRATVSFSCQ